MLGDQFQFRGLVHEEGYGWLTVETEDGVRYYLTTGYSPVVRLQPPVRFYTPLIDKTGIYDGMFREFADLHDASPEAMREFANRYGLLGGDITEVIPGTFLDERGNVVPVFGEDFKRWRREMTRMHRAVTLWDLIESNNEAQLGRHIRWSRNKDFISLEWPTPGRTIPRFPAMKILTQDKSPNEMAILTPGEVVRPAKMAVQRLINGGLKDRIGPEIVWSKDFSEMRMCIVTDSLLGAMWLKFARVVDGEVRQRRCMAPGCNRWMDIQRSTRKYCSDACESRARYKRRTEAAAHSMDT